MQLFLVASLPLLFATVVFLPWDRGHVPARLSLVAAYFKGVLLFFPGYLVILIVRAIVGFSYDGFLLYLSLLVRDHWAPLLAAVGGFLLLQRFMIISGTDESIFLTVFAFLSGFLSVLNLTDFVRAWGTWTGYELFLLPCLRIAAILMIAVIARRSFRWEGRDAARLATAVAVLMALLALGSFLLARSYPLWAGLGTAVALASSIVIFAMRFPRALRG